MRNDLGGDRDYGCDKATNREVANRKKSETFLKVLFAPCVLSKKENYFCLNMLICRIFSLSLHKNKKQAASRHNLRTNPKTRHLIYSLKTHRS